MLSHEQRQSFRDAQGQRVVDVLSVLGFQPDFSQGALGTFSGDEAQLPMRRFEQNGSVIRLGLSINALDSKWPFDWRGTYTRTDDTELSSMLGNHDSSPAELTRSLVCLLAAARWGVTVDRIPNYTPEYDEWEKGIEAAVEGCGGLAVASDNQTKFM